MARQDQVEDDGDKCGDGNRGSTKDGADPCGESSASKCAGRALNARAKGDRQTHERGIALRQAVAGKHDHTVHADGREHADRGAADYWLRNGREHCRALGQQSSDE